MNQLPGGPCALDPTLLGGLLNSYIPNIMCISSILTLLSGLVGMIGIATISLDHQLRLIACPWLQNIFVLAIILNWSTVATSFAGMTKRSTLMVFSLLLRHGQHHWAVYFPPA